MAWADKKQHFQEAGSIRQSLDSIMNDVKRIIAQIDHMTNTRTAWIQAVDDEKMDQAFVDVLDELKADIIPLRTACETYRDIYQTE